ncbi:phytoene/squalene synthase family protein [Rhodoplanes sp. Z2-YC6860]|uniref:phytoene/squalene synthase family protein n=1 Tax=Rhodoplanes sp. Z2-YC6860 TaxID=674703 RepID=UPI00078D28C1|nr:phytoene/squalene synthase family protein [Rhodoplanes sp. Z2-YC6860]AMN41881.1 phytoene synthase [Rhodoplanes sp. Z2-YC6860]
MADAFDHCEALVREGDKDRFLATLFVPAKYRRPLHALYAFNLEVARTRELAREPMPGEIRLQWWREVLGGMGRGDIDAHPVAAALRSTVVRYRLPPLALTGLIDARAFDLYDEPMASLDDLERYAKETSSVLIELAARILRDGRDPEIAEAAEHAGIAYAVVGLIKALPIHASRGQLYLPADLMHRHNAQTNDVFAGKATSELRAVLAELRLRARQHLTSVRENLSAVPAEVLPALLPVALVRPALGRMERRSYQPFAPSELPQWRRQWTLWLAARRSLRKAF